MKPWEYVLGFTDGREYSYWITAKSKDKILVNNDYQIDDEACIFISKSGNKSSPITCQVSLSKYNETNAALILRTNPTTKSLIAIQTGPTTVYCISHCNLAGKQMEKLQGVEIFSFENLYNVLSSEESISFDPSEAILSFGDNPGKNLTVTIRSKAAGGLFVSLVKYPFSGNYQTLSFEKSVCLGKTLKKDVKGLKHSSLRKSIIWLYLTSLVWVFLLHFFVTFISQKGH